MRLWDIPKHIEVINDELNEVMQRLATLEADMRWVKRLTILITGGVAAMLFKLFAG